VATKKEKALKTANRFLQRGQVDKAIREYEKLSAMDERDPRVRHKLGELYARKMRVGEALEEFRWVATHYEQGGFYLKAAAIYKQMLELDPDRMDVHLHLGEIYRSQGKTSEAALHFGNVAERVEREGSLSEKIGLYERLVRINPEDHDAFMRLVNLHVEAGSANKAIELLETLADTMRAAGDADQLLAALDRLCGIAEQTDAYSREIAQLHLQSGKPRAAVNRLQACFRANPQDTVTLALLGRAFSELGQTEKALQVLGELARIHGVQGDLDAQAEVEVQIRHIGGGGGSEAGSRAVAAKDLAPLQLRQDQPEAALQHIVRGETYLKYGLVERAMASSSTAAKRWPKLFDVQRLRAAVAEERGERADAAEAAMQMYSIAMDAGDLLAARRCLQECVRHRPSDRSLHDRLQAFEDAMADELDSLQHSDANPASAGAEGGSNLRDEIDVDIDEVFTRPESFTDGSLASGEGDLEALDENSLEVLTYENYLSEVASSASERGESYEDDREIQIEEDSGDEAENLDQSEDFEALLSEIATAIEKEVGGEDEEDTEDSVPAAATSGGAGTSMEIARGYYEVGLYEEALREYSNASAGGDAPQALLQMGRCNRQLQRWDDAIEALQRGLAEVGVDDALYLDLQYEIGRAYQEKGEGWAAYEAFGEIAQRDPAYRSEEVTSSLEEIAAQLGVGEG